MLQAYWQKKKKKGNCQYNVKMLIQISQINKLPYPQNSEVHPVKHGIYMIRFCVLKHDQLVP